MPITHAQIIEAACVGAKCPGMTVRAGVFYNAILAELPEIYDLGEARALHEFTFNGPTGTGAGPYTLPTDWLREERNSLCYTVDGTPYVPVWVEQTEYDHLATITNPEPRPLYFTIDIAASPPTAYFWPAATGSFPVKVRYYRRMPEVATPETSSGTPWFNHPNYLITRLTGELCAKITADESRAAALLSDKPGGDTIGPGAGYILSKILARTNRGSNNEVKRVTLDRRLYGRGSNSALRPTKEFPW